MFLFTLLNPIYFTDDKLVQCVKAKNKVSLITNQSLCNLCHKYISATYVINIRDTHNQQKG